MVFFWVGFAIIPFLSIAYEKSFASLSLLNSTPTNNPFPLIYFTKFLPIKVDNYFFKISPNLREFSHIFYYIITYRAVIAVCEAKGLPP